MLKISGFPLEEIDYIFTKSKVHGEGPGAMKQSIEMRREKMTGRRGNFVTTGSVETIAAEGEKEEVEYGKPEAA